MANLYLYVAPSNVELAVGESIQIQIYTNGTKYSYSISNTERISYSTTYREIKALAVGYVRLSITVEDSNGNSITKHINVVVSEATDSSINIMWHNRTTNRLTTLKAHANIEEDLDFNLPSATGKLLVDETVNSSNLRVIYQPEITSPKHGVTNYLGDIQASDFMLRFGNVAITHKKSYWQFATDSDFTNIIGCFVKEYDDLTKINHKYFDINTYVRVKYVGSDGSESLWSDAIYMHHGKADIGDDLNTITKGSAETGGYYGVIPYSDLVSNRKYKGDYTWLKNNYVKYAEDNSLTTAIIFQEGWLVSHNGTLYYAVQDMTTSTYQEPGDESTGTNGLYWAVDNRLPLGTYEWLVDHLGIGCGVIPNSTYSSYDVKYVTYNNNISNVIYPEGSYIKFNYKGKILYVSQKPICNNIAWNDLAKQSLTLNNRTIRIANQLYKIRLLTQEEYKALFVDLWEDDSTTKATFVLTDYQFIHDEQTGAYRNVIDEDGNVGSIDPKARDGVWRIVLEVVDEGDAAYCNLPPCAQGNGTYTSEIIYDKYTDTGFIGYISSTGDDSTNGYSVPTTSIVVTTMNISTYGTANTSSAWLIYYWHGQIIYISNAYGFSLSSSYYSLYYANQDYSYACDMGEGSKASLTYNDVEYLPFIPEVIRIQPTSTVSDDVYNDWMIGSHMYDLISRSNTQFLTNAIYYKKTDGTYKTVTSVSSNYGHGGYPSGEIFNSSLNNFTSSSYVLGSSGYVAYSPSSGSPLVTHMSNCSTTLYAYVALQLKYTDEVDSDTISDM